MKRFIFILLLVFILPVQAQYNGVKPILGVPINWSYPQARGLIGYWLMNEDGGNLVNDLSGNGHHGDMKAGVIWQLGRFGPATYGDGGATGYIDTGYLWDVGTGSFTLSCWYKGTDTTSWIGLMGGAQTGSTGAILGVNAGGGADEKYLFGYINNNTYANGTTDVTDNQWHHCVFLRDGAIGRLYVDGLAECADFAVNAATVDNAQAIWIYGWGNASYTIAGQIDLPMIYRRALIASEIQQLYYYPFCIFDQEHPELYVTSGEEPTTRPQVIIIMSRLMPFMPVWVIFIMILGFRIAERDNDVEHTG